MKKLIRITSIPLSMEKLLGDQLSYMNTHYEVTAVSSNEEELSIIAKNFGVKHFSIEMTRSITPFKDLRAIFRMYRFFKRVKPDIVHSHTPKAGLVAMIAGFLAGVPIRLHTVAGLPLLESSGARRKVLSHVERLIYALSTKVYPNSAQLKKIILKEKFCKDSKVKVLGNGSSNGIDLSHFKQQNISSETKDTLKKQLNISEGDFVFVFLGRLVKDKGINELVSAFKSISEIKFKNTEYDLEEALAQTGINNFQLKSKNKEGKKSKGLVLSESYFNNSPSITGLKLRNRLGRMLYRYNVGKYEIIKTKENFYTEDLYGFTNNFMPFTQHYSYPNVKLLLVGPMEQELNPILGITLAEIGHNPQIITTGYVKDVRPYLSLSNCLVLPSYREGFPNSVLQAGAMDLPSIVSDINGCNEIITDGENGLIVPAKSEEDLKIAMLKLLDEPEFTEKLKSTSRKTVEAHYSHQKLWDEIRVEYESFFKK